MTVDLRGSEITSAIRRPSQGNPQPVGTGDPQTFRRKMEAGPGRSHLTGPRTEAPTLTKEPGMPNATPTCLHDATLTDALAFIDAGLKYLTVEYDQAAALGIDPVASAALMLDRARELLEDGR